MKKYSKLVFMLCLFFVGINFVSAKELLATCSYKSSDNKFQATVAVEQNIFKFKSTDLSNVVYDGENVEHFNLKWKILKDSEDAENSEETKNCYKYVGIYKKPNYGIENEVSYSYELYATNDIEELISDDNNYQIMGLDGTDAVEEASSKSNVIYYSGATGKQFGNNKYVEEIPEDVKFKFISYNNGKKEFCVLIDDNTKCGYMNGDTAPVISISGSKRDYKFSIDSSTSSYFFNEFSSEYWRFDISTDVYKLVYHYELENTTGKDSGHLNPGKICGKDGENCNVSLATFCTDAKVARILKGVGTLIVIAKILVPAIIILMGFVNLFKIITAGKEDEARKYAKSIITKVIIGVIIFLLPGLINFVFDIANNIIASNNDYQSEFTNCEKCILDISECNINGN